MELNFEAEEDIENLSKDENATSNAETSTKTKRRPLRQRLTDLKFDDLVDKGQRLALASDVWRFARPSPKCSVLLCLAPEHPNAASLTTWLVQQIRLHEPGLKFQVYHHQLTGAYAIYLTARYITLLKGAELLHLRKPLKARYGGGMRDFSIVEANTFQGVEDRESFLNGQEKALIVKTFLDGIRAQKSGETITFESIDIEKPSLNLNLREGEPIS